MGKGDSRPGRTLTVFEGRPASPECHLQRTSFCEVRKVPSAPAKPAVVTTCLGHDQTVYVIVASYGIWLSNERAISGSPFIPSPVGFTGVSRVCQRRGGWHRLSRAGPVTSIKWVSSACGRLAFPCLENVPRGTFLRVIMCRRYSCGTVLNHPILRLCRWHLRCSS